MLDSENNYSEELVDRVPSVSLQESRNQASLEIRRRIEHIREIKRLRELLDDPNFSELNYYNN